MEISKNRPVRTTLNARTFGQRTCVFRLNAADLSRISHLGFIRTRVSALLEGRFRLLDDRSESIGLADGDFREHLAIQFDSCASETENEV